jgi:hypothetical protein
MMEGTAQTINYAIAGFVVIFGAMGFYLVSLVVRWRNLKQDEVSLKVVEERSRKKKRRLEKALVRCHVQRLGARASTEPGFYLGNMVGDGTDVDPQTRGDLFIGQPFCKAGQYLALTTAKWSFVCGFAGQVGRGGHDYHQPALAGNLVG